MIILLKNIIYCIRIEKYSDSDMRVKNKIFMNKIQSDRSGAIAVVFALMIPVLFGVVAVSTDVGRIFLGNITIQSNHDSACLAAVVKGLEVHGRKRIASNNSILRNDYHRHFHILNFRTNSGEFMGIQLYPVNVRTTRLSNGGAEFRFTRSGYIPMTFGSILNYPRYNFTLSCSVEVELPPAELAIAFDSSNRMAEAGMGNSVRMVPLRNELINFLYKFYDGDSTIPDTYVSLIQYSNAVQIIDPLSGHWTANGTRNRYEFINGFLRNPYPALQMQFRSSILAGSIGQRDNGYDVTDQPPIAGNSSTLFKRDLGFRDVNGRNMLSVFAGKFGGYGRGSVTNLPISRYQVTDLTFPTGEEVTRFDFTRTPVNPNNYFPHRNRNRNNCMRFWTEMDYNEDGSYEMLYFNFGEGYRRTIVTWTADRISRREPEYGRWRAFNHNNYVETYGRFSEAMWESFEPNLSTYTGELFVGRRASNRPNSWNDMYAAGTRRTSSVCSLFAIDACKTNPSRCSCSGDNWRGPDKSAVYMHDNTKRIASGILYGGTIKTLQIDPITNGNAPGGFQPFKRTYGAKYDPRCNWYSLSIYDHCSPGAEGYFPVICYSSWKNNPCRNGTSHPMWPSALSGHPNMNKLIMDPPARCDGTNHNPPNYNPPKPLSAASFVDTHEGACNGLSNCTWDNSDFSIQDLDVRYRFANASSLFLTTVRKDAENALKDHIWIGNPPRHNVGIAWAWYALSPRWRGIMPPYRNANTVLSQAPQDYGNVRKILILVAHDDFFDNTDRNEFRSLCSNIKNSGGIELYTIAYDVRSASLRNELSNCVASSEYFVNANNITTLRDAFNTISSRRYDVRLKL